MDTSKLSMICLTKSLITTQLVEEILPEPSRMKAKSTGTGQFAGGTQTNKQVNKNASRQSFHTMMSEMPINDTQTFFTPAAQEENSYRSF